MVFVMTEKSVKCTKIINNDYCSSFSRVRFQFPFIDETVKENENIIDQNKRTEDWKYWTIVNDCNSATHMSRKKENWSSSSDEKA